MKKYAFGADVGGTTVKMGLFETTGNLLETWEIPTVTANDGAAILPDISRTIAEKMDEKNISPDDVEGIGMGVPGPVLNDGTVNKCINLGWGVINVEQILGELTQKQLNQKERPSLIKQLAKIKNMVKAIPSKARRHEQEHDR